jgi:putative proteasome-type protease
LTYCLGILLSTGLILASDSRSNAGVDQVQQVCKLALITVPQERVIAILSQGNLATTQSVVTRLRQAAGGGEAGLDLHGARTLFDAASIVGGALRRVLDQDAKYVEPYGSPDGGFLVGGQIAGEAPRLFQIYSAGNFVEATPRSCFVQAGETKYGKPILDRALTFDSSLEHAAKLALLSFDATVRSNLSVGLPIDLLRYEADSLSTEGFVTLGDENDYWRRLRDQYAAGLSTLVDSLPAPPAAWT